MKFLALHFHHSSLPTQSKVSERKSWALKHKVEEFSHHAGIPFYSTSSFRCCPTTMSSLSSSYKSFSNPSSGNREHRPNGSPSEPYFPPTLGGIVGYSDKNPHLPDPRDKDFPSAPATIPLRDYHAANPNFLEESSCSSFSLDRGSSMGPHQEPQDTLGRSSSSSKVKKKV